MEKDLYYIDVPYACFGVITNEYNIVIRVAPIAKWTIGKPIIEVLKYYVKRNKNKIKIVRIPIFK